jgi:dipeptidyl aminopeptidase/acylaminoacyl peptidase
MAAEFAYPHWVFGLSTYSFADANTIVCTYSQDGYWHLARLCLLEQTLTTIETDNSNFSSLACHGQTLVCIASSPTEAARVMAYDLKSQAWEILKRSSDVTLDPGYLSIPQAISFPTPDHQIAHAWYYPPQNQDYQGPAGERPPLLVKSHGGPTAQASNALNLRVQYWTSRGFAYVDVNYGGSTGYGRAYRQRLEGQWGCVDVADCVAAAEYLVTQGWVDGDKLAISGGSAGGYTTLAALTFHDTFKAGASYYGVSDLEALAKDTHKFEARYLDRLVGPYPEELDRYRQRSPIYALERLHCPVIFFQGLEDKVVPPSQTEVMVAALREKGIPVAYVPFAEEQHGFRIATNIKRALEGEFYFYSRIFGFTPAEALAPVEIMNL